MSDRTCDVVVIGAGPAGVSAAIAASEQGLDVVLVDEQAKAGGQVYRAPADGMSAKNRGRTDRDFRDGQELRDRLTRSSVRHINEGQVWTVSERFVVDVAGRRGPLRISAPRLIAATGAYERVVPFPGWTSPGVIGLAAATVLIKSQGNIPGRRILIAGCGPLLLAVAAKAVRLGVEVAAIVDVSPRRTWLSILPDLATRPSLLYEGMRWMFSIQSRRVPVYFGHIIRRVEGTPGRISAAIGPAPSSGKPRQGPETKLDDLDLVIVGHGLVPGSEIAKLLGARHRYDRRLGGWVPELDPDGRTSIAGLYAAGDGTGIRGSRPAHMSGTLAGLAAVRDSNAKTGAASALAPIEQSMWALRAQLGGMDRFAKAISGMLALRPELIGAIAVDTVVCRCEDVTRREIDAAFDDGARDVNQLKHFTRCGMGPCQGRMCGDVVGELLGQRLGSREAAGYWTQRPPLRPVPLTELIGDFTYDDIPIPKPAPL